jgi:DNA-directed RNA polymerase subunit RPC12/RpoP
MTQALETWYSCPACGKQVWRQEWSGEGGSPEEIREYADSLRDPECPACGAAMRPTGHVVPID